MWQRSCGESNMVAWDAVLLGVVVAGFETVIGTLIAVLLTAVLLDGQTDLYNAVLVSAAAAITMSIVYQFFDPTFAHLATYLQGPRTTSSLYGNVLGPLARFAAAHVAVDAAFITVVYRSRRELHSWLFAGVYSATKVGLTVSIWILFIAPAFT